MDRLELPDYEQLLNLVPREQTHLRQKLEGKLAELRTRKWHNDHAEKLRKKGLA